MQGCSLNQCDQNSLPFSQPSRSNTLHSRNPPCQPRQRDESTIMFAQHYAIQINRLHASSPTVLRRAVSCPQEWHEQLSARACIRLASRTSTRVPRREPHSRSRTAAWNRARGWKPFWWPQRCSPAVADPFRAPSSRPLPAEQVAGWEPAHTRTIWQSESGALDTAVCSARSDQSCPAEPPSRFGTPIDSVRRPCRRRFELTHNLTPDS